MSSRLSRWNLLIPLVLGSALVLALLLTRRPVAPPHLAPTPVLAELARTNLVRSAGLWFQIGHTNPFTGILVETYPGGHLMSRSVVAKGLLNGLSEGWYTNGQLQVSESYRANFSDGIRTRWYANGKKLSEARVVAGKIQGIYRRWYADGVLSEEIPMHDGEIEGEGRAYYESGCVKAVVEYHGGKVVRQQTWKDGEQKSAGTANAWI